MKYQTIISVPSKYTTYEIETELKRLDFLYPAIIGQEIRLNCEGENYKVKVVNVEDSIYEDIIFRYVEVVVIKNI